MTNRWTNATEEQKQKFKESVSEWKKKAWKILSKEEKTKHIRQLKINAEKWRKNKSEESKKSSKKKCLMLWKRDGGIINIKNLNVDRFLSKWRCNGVPILKKKKKLKYKT